MQSFPINAGMWLRCRQYGTPAALRRPLEGVDVDIGKTERALTKRLEAVLEVFGDLVPIFVAILVVVVGVQVLLDTFLRDID